MIEKVAYQNIENKWIALWMSPTVGPFDTKEQALLALHDEELAKPTTNNARVEICTCEVLEYNSNRTLVTLIVSSGCSVHDVQTSPVA